MWREQGENITYYDTSRLLPSIKSSNDFSWLANADSMALQESLRNLDNAFQSFFSKRCGYPRFKSKRDNHQSYTTRNVSNIIRVEDRHINLPKVGRVRIKLHRTFKGRILNATISKTPTNKYFVSLCVEEEFFLKQNAGGLVGIDVGIESFYTDSNGNSVEPHNSLRKYERKLRKEQRKLSRKQFNSSNYEKQRLRVALVHEKVSNARFDFLHKASHRLVSENQVIAIETLSVNNLVKNHSLAKSISDASWSKFFQLLESKSYEYGCRVVKVPRFAPTSQLCSHCGYKNPLLKNLSIREWECPNCHSVHLRDCNAAINILNIALSSA